MRYSFACLALALFAMTSIVLLRAAEDTDSGVVIEEEAALQEDEDFDEAIIDFGLLAGTVRSCISEDEAKLITHETRAFDIYSKITQAFGIDVILPVAFSGAES